MTVYVDGLRSYQQAPNPGAERYFGNGKRSCHMATDGDYEELHQLAARIGLRRAWFQIDASIPHYDLTPSKRALAVKGGAVEITRVELVERCRRSSKEG